MEVEVRKEKKKRRSKIDESPEDLTQEHPTKRKGSHFHVAEKSDGRLDNQLKKKKKREKDAASQGTSPGVSIAENTPVDQVGKTKRKKKQVNNIVESSEDLIQKHSTKQKASDFHVGEKSHGGPDNQPKKKKKKKKKEKEAGSQETRPAVSIPVNTPADQVVERKRNKKRLSNIRESPDDLTQKHSTKQKALDFHVGKKSHGGLDDQPKKKKKKKKEKESQQIGPGVCIAVNTPVDQVVERKRKKKRLSYIGENPDDLIQRNSTKQKALDFHVGEKSHGGLDDQPKKKKKKKEKKAGSQETRPGVSIAVDTPVDQVVERKRKKKRLSNIEENPDDLIQKHSTKQKALDFHVGEKSHGGLDDQPKKKKKKMENEAGSQETRPGVSIAVGTPVDQVVESKRKRKKKQRSNIGESPEDLAQKLPTKRKPSDVHVGEETDSGLDIRPKKKRKKEKESVSQETSPGVDQKMEAETSLTTPVDQRTKPETALTTPEATLPISLEIGGTGTGSIQPTAGQMFKYHATTTVSFYLKEKTLDETFEKLSRAIESAKRTKGQVRDNIWFKQKFSIGINDVTRTLERMPTALGEANMNDESDIEHLKNFQETLQHFPASQDSHLEDKGPGKLIARSLGKPEPVVQLQAVMVALDCRPGVLTSHIHSLASSRGVPLLTLSDHGKGSLRLGQLFMLRAAITIGIKVGQSPINKTIQDILDDRSVHRRWVRIK